MPADLIPNAAGSDGAAEPCPPRGRTVREFAAYYRVSKSKVLRFIASGELRAVNMAGRPRDGKPRWVITPDAQAEFERGRAAGPTPRPKRRRRLPVGFVDFFPN